MFRNKRNNIFFILVFLLFLPSVLFAVSDMEQNLMERMTSLVFQISVIIFLAYIFGGIAKKIKMPSVFGELLVGILISPFLLGKIPLPGFPQGLFPPIGDFIISPELYSISILASIILLFKSGLETDFNILLSYFGSGFIVAIGGVVVSFFIGLFISYSVFHFSLFSPQSLMIGIITVATSVGITVRILAENKKVNSPEGVTIIAAAVIDDVLGIILLAIVMSLIVSFKKSGQLQIQWVSIELLALKTFILWLGVTVLGVVFSFRISSFIKKFRSKVEMTVASFGLALLLAGFFEKAGLAMIIGAYIMGFSLSNTDLRYVILENLKVLESFFIPIFFVVMGMMVNLKVFTDSRVLLFGIIFSIGSFISKFLGAGVPALFTNFNLLGATRIGVGMIPRGEVALTIAALGLSYGILNQEIYGGSIMMIFFTTFFVAPVLNLLFKIKKEGVKKDLLNKEKEKIIEFSFPNPAINTFFLNRMLEQFKEEGFFVVFIAEEAETYFIRRKNVFFKIEKTETDLSIIIDPSDEIYIRTLVNETYYEFARILKDTESSINFENFKGIDNIQTDKFYFNIGDFIDSRAVLLNMVSNDKENIIKELVEAGMKTGRIINKEEVLKDVFEREKTMSTGMTDGVAIPHAKTEGITRPLIVIGFKREGVDFESMDGKPTVIFVLILMPEKFPEPYLQILADISAILKEEKSRQVLLKCQTTEQVKQFFISKTMNKNKAWWSFLWNKIRGI